MAMRRVDGVQKVDGNAREKTVTIEFDSEAVSLGNIKEAMARIGYDTGEV